MLNGTWARAAVIAALVSGATRGSEIVVWPSYLAPVARHCEQDSARRYISGRQSVYAEGRDLESNDTLRVTAFDSLWWFEQNVRYDLSKKYETRYQSLDLSGRYIRNISARTNSSLGLEWNPWLNLMQRNRATGWFQGIIDVGPAWRAAPGDLPLMLRGGVSARGWNDRVPDNVFRTPYEGFSASPGFYGGVAFGEGHRLASHLPLYLSLSAFGRYIEDAGYGTVMASARYAHALPAGDSLYVYLADSVLNGRDAYLTEAAGGKTAAINSPWRVANALHVCAALKGATRLHVAPSLVYNYRHGLLQYPDNPPGHAGDRRDGAHRVAVSATTDTLLFFRYHGALAFSFSSYDAQERSRWVRVGDSVVAQALPSEDYRGNTAAMEHELAVPFRYGGLLEYRYYINRRSITYHNEDAPLVAVNVDDHDRQRQVHTLTAVLLQSPQWQLGVSGAYARDVLNYIRPQRSGRNRTDRQYVLNTTLSYRYAERLMLTESLRAEANTAEYAYPQVHQGPEKAPPYSRRFSSELSARVVLAERWSVQGKWDQVYWDDGRWYGKEYVDIDSTTGAVTDGGYYAIERKSTEYRIALGAVYAPGAQLRIEAGAALQDIYQREFTGSSYEVRHYDKGYMLEPYLRLDWALRERVRLNAYVRRLIDTFDEQKWSLNDNWDIRLFLGVRL